MTHDDYSLVPRQRGLGTRLDDMSYQLAIDYISLVPRPDLGTRIRGHTIDNKLAIPKIDFIMFTSKPVPNLTQEAGRKYH